MDLIAESLVVFVLSTTGQGDFPPSAIRFWQFLLRADLPTDVLSDVTFATFGLGDSSYKRYCWPVRKLNRRLSGLGALELLPSGEADDQHFLGIDGALQPWLEQLWNVIDEVMPIEGDGSEQEMIPDDVLLEPEIAVSLAEGANIAGSSSSGATSSAKAASPLGPGWQWATLTKNERMTAPDHFQDVRLLKIQSDAGDIDYNAGDVVSLQPANLLEDVDRFLARMGWLAIAEAPLDLHHTTSFSLPPGCPRQPTTLRDLATHVLDILSVPRQSFFEAILPFSKPGSLQREKLQEYVTPGEGADDMYEYAQRVRRTILEVLEEFGDVEIPLKYVLDVVPTMRPRDFSIASAPSPHHDELELAVAVVRYKTRLQAPRRGVLTHYLANLQVPVRIPIQLKRGTFRLPLEKASPCIFVGPGTGIAPMRSLLQARLASKTASSPSFPTAGEDVVFAGCRFEAKDFLFGTELRKLASEGRFGQLFLAASRDSHLYNGSANGTGAAPEAEASRGGEEELGGRGKFYVQNAIRAQAKLVRRLVLEKGAWVYVSGSSGKMPEAVRAAFVQVLAIGDDSSTHPDDARATQMGDENASRDRDKRGMSEEGAEEYLSKMEREGRWQEECWS